MKNNIITLIKIIKDIGIEGIKSIEEKDPQYLAIKKMKDIDSGVLIKYVITNSLICYQLSGKGEDYWNEFAYKLIITNNLYEDMVNFLKVSTFNKRLINSKIKRLKKIQKIVETIDVSISFEDLWKKLSLFGRYKKTVLFSIKTFGYTKRIIENKFIPFPMNIPIPIDSRIKKITKLITDEKPQRFWQFISIKTNIPPLHIDSIIWNAIGKNKANELNKMKEFLKVYIYK